MILRTYTGSAHAEFFAALDARSERHNFFKVDGAHTWCPHVSVDYLCSGGPCTSHGPPDLNPCLVRLDDYGLAIILNSLYDRVVLAYQDVGKDAPSLLLKCTPLQVNAFDEHLLELDTLQPGLKSRLQNSMVDADRAKLPARPPGSGSNKGQKRHQ